MKLIPSDNLLKHLLEQNVTMPLGGFDIPDTAYADIDFDLRRHPIHASDSEEEIKYRVDYAAIWRFHGVEQNNGATGQELQNVQKTASLTRQIVEMADTHLPNAAEKISAAVDDSANVIHAAVSELKSMTHLGHQEITQAVAGLKMFSAESHAEALKVRGDLHSDLMELGGKLLRVGKWLLGVISGFALTAIVFVVVMLILGVHAHCQSTVIIGAQKGTTTSGAVTASDVDANHKALDVSVVAGGGTGGGPADTAPSATASESDVARQKVTSVLRLWDQTGLAGAQLVTLRGDLTNGAWVNCKSGCSSTSFADRSAFTFGTTSFGVLGGVFDDTPPAALTTGLAGAARVTANRAIHINLRNAAGTEIGTAGTPIQVSLANTGANGTALKVDGSAVTQPVSGTVTTSPPANASTNIAQVGGTATDTNSGLKSAGTIRVVIATDQPALTNKLLVTPDSVALPANQSVNVSQINGVTPLMGNGITGTGSQRVTIASDNTAFPVNATLSAETTKVIGTVNIAASQTVGLVAGSAVIGHVINDAGSAVIGHVIADTGSTTAVTGNVTAVQATGSNLHVQVDTAPSTAVTNAGTFAVQAVGTLGDNGSTATTNRVGTLPAIALATPPAAKTSGRDSAILSDLHGIPYSSVMPTDVTSYVASKQGLASAASATDIAVLSGNASNAVIVTKIMVSCTQTTAGIIDLILLKRSTADTAGTSTGSPTTVPLDSSNAAGSSSVLTYTANPTTGSLVGNVDVVKLGCMATGTAAPNDIYIWRPSMGQSIVLRGTAQQIAVNLNAATVTGGSFNITIQWIEATNY